MTGMDLSAHARTQADAAALFGSFYYRATPRWRDRRGALIAYGSAIGFGCAVLSVALAVFG
jgi:hypothetical protein